MRQASCGTHGSGRLMEIWRPSRDLFSLLVAHGHQGPAVPSLIHTVPSDRLGTAVQGRHWAGGRLLAPMASWSGGKLPGARPERIGACAYHLQEDES